eukprot:COSAG06_NODE_6084_length_3119_cov_1.657947_3_plen_44_part_01
MYQERAWNRAGAITHGSKRAAAAAARYYRTGIASAAAYRWLLPA